MACTRRGELVLCALMAGLVLGPAACSREEPAGAVTRPAAGQAPARDSSALAPGRSRISVDGQRVSISSNDAELVAILSRLSDELDFDLELGDLQLSRVSVEIEDRPIAEALPVLLSGVKYDTDFVPADGGGHRLSALRIGSWRGAPAAAAPTAVAETVRPRRQEPRQREDAEEYEDDDWRSSRDEDDAEQARQIDLLDSNDARIREDAVYEIDPEGDGLRALIEIVRNDPDPDVRIAAVSQLEDADTHAAVQGLVEALRDRDRRVVLEAIDALEFAGDESIIPDLEVFLDSPDREVRKAAEEAIEFLE